MKNKPSHNINWDGLLFYNAFMIYQHYHLAKYIKYYSDNHGPFAPAFSNKKYNPNFLAITQSCE